MPSPNMHLLLTAGGSYTDTVEGEEAWAVGVRLALVFGSIDPIGTLPTNWLPAAQIINRTEADWTITGNWNTALGGNTFNPDDFLNDQAAPAFGTWLGATLSSTQVRMDWLKLAPISSPLGREEPAIPYLTGSPCLLTWTGAQPVGSEGGGLLPLQISCVCGHRTSQVGSRGRGRMFIPGCARNAMDASTAYWTSTTQNRVTGAQKDLLNALTWAGIGVGAANTQPIITGKPFETYAVITSVRCGNVPDTQVRRKKSLPVTYVTESL